MSKKTRITDLIQDIQNLNNSSTKLNRSLRSMFGPFEQLHFKMPVGGMQNGSFVIFCEDLSQIGIEQLAHMIPFLCDSANTDEFQIYFKNLSDLVYRKHKKLTESKLSKTELHNTAFEYLSDEYVIRLYSMFNTLRIYDTTYTLPNHLKGLLYG